MLMGSQIRAARALLRMTLGGLAEASGVSVATIIRAEKQDGVPSVTRANLAAIQGALERHGVVFGPDSGVSLRAPGEEQLP